MATRTRSLAPRTFDVPPRARVAAPTVMAAVVDLMKSRRSMGMMGSPSAAWVVSVLTCNFAPLEKVGAWEVGWVVPSIFGKSPPSETEGGAPTERPYTTLHPCQGFAGAFAGGADSLEERTNWRTSARCLSRSARGG